MSADVNTTVSATTRSILAARLLGYLNQPHWAVDLLTHVLEEHPGDVRLLRFRGHRRITTHDYTGAESDLSKASQQLDQVEDEYEMYQDEVVKDLVCLVLDEPDEVRPQHLPASSYTGLDTDTQCLYRTTLHTSVWYHLGVAQYLLGKFDDCITSFRNAELTAQHPEGQAASQDWQVMGLRRLGRNQEVQEVLDRFLGLELPKETRSMLGYDRRMQLYAGRLSPQEFIRGIATTPLQAVTERYGLGNWFLAAGDLVAADREFKQVLDSGVTGAFAYLAAKEEYSRDNILVNLRTKES